MFRINFRTNFRDGSFLISKKKRRKKRRKKKGIIIPSREIACDPISNRIGRCRFNYHPPRCSAWLEPGLNRTKLKWIMRVIKRIQLVPSVGRPPSLNEPRRFRCPSKASNATRNQVSSSSLSFSLSLSPSLCLCCFFSRLASFFFRSTPVTLRLLPPVRGLITRRLR